MPWTMLRTLLGALALLVGTGAQAQAGPPPWADYVGTYAAAGGGQLEIVAGPLLFAVIDEAKYPLQHLAGDAFQTRSGERVEFLRDAAGRVSGYRTNGLDHPRHSAEVNPLSAALAWPRPEQPGLGNRYRYRAPQARDDGIAVADAAEAGTAAAWAPATLERVVQGVLDGTWPDVHSLLVHHKGRLILEEYFYGYHAERPHQLRSATKSVVSALAGIASTRDGAPQSGSAVLARLPYAQLAQPDERKARITLQHLLTMRSGLACNDHDAASPGNETRLYESDDWVKATLDLPLVHEPGTEAAYCSGGVAVVGRLTERAVGQPLPEFAHDGLFAPLGIRRADWRWNYRLDRSNREFSQIHMRPRDLLKFGLVFAQGGRWQGHQIVPEAWVQSSLAVHSSIRGTDYGYFWWRPWLNVDTARGPQRVSFHSAQGNGGQRIYILPEHELVVVFTGGDYNSGAAPPNRIMATVILPALLGVQGPAAGR
jgi:CubicO group peptidase (beta-lactamase class C family)